MMADAKLENIVGDRYVVYHNKALLAQIRADFTADLKLAKITGEPATKLVKIMDTDHIPDVSHKVTLSIESVSVAPFNVLSRTILLSASLTTILNSPLAVAVISSL